MSGAWGRTPAREGPDAKKSVLLTAAEHDLVPARHRGATLLAGRLAGRLRFGLRLRIRVTARLGAVCSLLGGCAGHLRQRLGRRLEGGVRRSLGGCLRGLLDLTHRSGGLGQVHRRPVGAFLPIGTRAWRESVSPSCSLSVVAS